MLLTRGVCRWFLGFYLVLIVMAHGSAWAQNNDASLSVRVPPTRRLTPAEVPAYVQGVVVELQWLTAELRALGAPDQNRVAGYRDTNVQAQSEAFERAAVLRAQGQELLTEMVYMLAAVQDSRNARYQDQELFDSFENLDFGVMVIGLLVVTGFISIGGARYLAQYHPGSEYLWFFILPMIAPLSLNVLSHHVQRFLNGRLPRDIPTSLKNDREATQAFILAQRALAEAGIDLTVFGLSADPHAIARALTADRNWASGPYKNVRSLCAHLLEPRRDRAEGPSSGLEPNHLTGVRIAPESMEPSASSRPTSAEELPAANPPGRRQSRRRPTKRRLNRRCDCTKATKAAGA